MLIESKLGIEDYKVINNDEIRIYDESAKPDVINKMLICENVEISGIYESGVSLEDYFKQLIGEEN